MRISVLIHACPERMAISNGVRARSINEGMGMESVTLDDWLESIESK